MRVVLQRVKKASVTIDGNVTACIDRGILALVGMNKGDNEDTFKWMLNKLVNIRIFEDENDKMNLSVSDLDYGILLVPNFTIYADARKGNRPSFAMGAGPEEARESFNKFTEYAKANFKNVQTGTFRAYMQVELVNDGPITILLDSDKLL